MSLFVANDGKLRLAWRFLFAFFLTVAVVMFSGWIPFVLGVPGMPGLFVDRAGGALVLLAIYLFFLRTADHSATPMGDLGFPPAGAKTFWKGFAFAAAMISAAVIAIAVGGRYAAHLDTAANLASVVVVMLVLLAGAAFEELAFRGYVFQRLCEIAHPLGAILFFSALFGAIHYFNPSWSWIAFVNTLLVGILFAIAYLRTRSLWVVWGMHFGWNIVLGTIFGLPVSGLSIFSVLTKGEAQGSELLTGGGYGIEGSLTGTVVIGMGIVLVPLFFARLPDRELDKTTGTSGGIQAV